MLAPHPHPLCFIFWVRILLKLEGSSVVFIVGIMNAMPQKGLWWSMMKALAFLAQGLGFETSET
jgi:hypothetical protein